MLDALRYAEQGYAVVVQDTRGRFASDGAFYPFRHEAEDGADTIAWAAALPYGNGRVGLFGASYAGATQWLAASAAPPALGAMTPARSAASYYQPWAYQGGVLQLGFLLHWALSSLGPDTVRRLVGAGAAPPAWPARLGQAIDAFEELARERPPLAHDSLTELAAAALPYFRDWLAHPTDDAYWRAWDVERRLDAVATPTLHIGGWYDIFLPGTLRAFTTQQHRRQDGIPTQRLVIGPWAHGPMNEVVGAVQFGVAAGGEAAGVGGMLRQWFDAWLLGGETALAGQAPVRLFVMGANVWRDEQEWPLARACPTRYYLHAGGALSEEPPAHETPDTYRYDPASPAPTLGGGTLMEGHAVNRNAGPRDQRPLEARPDVLVYTSPPLTRPLEVSGPVSLELYASSSGEDTDWVARLIDVYPDGSAMLIADGILRARYRDGTAEAAFLEPGRVYRFEVDLVATSNLFRAGHRLRVHVTSSSFPRFAPNPNARVDNPYLESAEPRGARQTVYHEAAYPSCVVLPVVPGED
jgi:putative CocE/NonD family hydrolase